MPRNEETLYILVTGANTGLGLGICKRLLDMHLSTTTSEVHLTVTTRSAAKSQATLAALQSYLDRSPTAKAFWQGRVTLGSAELDLTDLASVVAAAAQLSSTLPRLDVVVCNAGISGPHAMKWALAVWSVLSSPIHSVTWPRFYTGQRGQLAPAQEVVGPAASHGKQPELGMVFCANVFGHYLLVHHLSQLLCGAGGSGKDARREPARVLWVSSIDTPHYRFSTSDLQGLADVFSYESSKRLTDLLVLTSTLPAAAASLQSFWNAPAPPWDRALRSRRGPDAPDAAAFQTPAMYLLHPGVVGTDIVALNPVMKFFKLISFYVARLLGSPWHPISAYKGAMAAAWLALVPLVILNAAEEVPRNGKAKWGSATGRTGKNYVRRTEVDGYGYGGIVGQEADYAGGKRGRVGRRDDSVDATPETIIQFQDTGVKCWEMMEQLRREWEVRLGTDASKHGANGKANGQK